MKILPASKNYLFVFVFLLTLIGGLLRFYNLNWDEGQNFHPDERNIDAAVSRISFFDQMDPKFFAYGGLPFYTYRATGEIIAFITKDTGWLHDWGKINIIARSFSAFISTLTIPLAFVLAKKLFGETTAFISTTIFTFTPSFIQTAHFGITENFLVFAVVLLSTTSINLYEKPGIKKYIKNGIAWGLAVAAKTTSLSFALIPLTAFLLVATKKRRPLLNLIKSTPAFFVLLIVGALVFTLSSPYTFLSWNKFLESMSYEYGVASGLLPVPYTLQFTNTTPYLFQIKNLIFQIGPVAYLSIIGVMLLLIETFRNKNYKYLIILIFPLAYFSYVGSWHTKFIRFMMPILPFIILFAAYTLAFIRENFKTLGNLLIIAFLIPTILWGLAFFSIYSREQTRISASRWVYENIPAESKILGEHWDDGLPVSLPPLTRSFYKYDIEQLTIYDSDNEQKLEYYSQKLPEGDYIIINSRRLYGTLINLTDKYPLTSRYYKLLFSEKLGYEKVAEFTSYPSIFGFEINDDASEETFQVYDHPKVIILKNADRFTSEEIRKILTD